MLRFGEIRVCVVFFLIWQRKKNKIKPRIRRKEERESAVVLVLREKEGELYLEEKKDRKWDPLSYMKRTWTPLCFLF